MKQRAMKVALTLALGLVTAGSAWGWNEGGGEQEAALNLQGNVEKGRAVFEVCASCHLPEAWGTPDGTFPELAGQHRAVLIKQLADIRARNRDNPTMEPFTEPKTIGGPQAMADVVAYIETIPMNPSPGVGPWEPGTPEYAAGEALYTENCTQCHGHHGQGDAQKFFPRIGGQHYLYMTRQFQWIRDGKRRNADPDMVQQIQGFSDEDIELVINWVSRQLPPKKLLAPSADWVNPDFK